MAIKFPKYQTENTQDAQFCKKCSTLLPSVGDAESSFTRTIEMPVDALSREALFSMIGGK